VLPQRWTAEQIERRLLLLAGAFICLYAIALTLSPAARLRNWQVDYRWLHWLGVAAWVGMFALAQRALVRWLPGRDPYLLPVAALLSGWGLLTIWRLEPQYGLRQSAWLAVGTGIFILGLRLPNGLDLLRRYKYIWLTSGLLLTAATLVFGTNPLGAGPRLWLGCCGFYFQPSEPLKLLLIIYLAAYLADRWPAQPGADSDRPNPSLLPLLGPTLIMTGLALLLLTVQRDLGTASIFLFLYAAITYAATGDRRVVWISALAVILAGLAGYALFDVVRLRVEAWLNPWLDPSGRSYQIVQSLLAVANGGLVGRGPGLGSPGLVPVAISDFIFAAIAEENGLAGILGLLALLALLTGRGVRRALGAPDAFRRLLAAGLAAYLAAQSILIIGGNLRLLPLTGVTLPFVSYGGSSLLSAFLALLLLLQAGAETHKPAQLIQPNSQPYRQLSTALLVGLAAAGLVAGWWGIWRGPDLLERTDNARRGIADLYVKRGTLFDQHNQPLAQSSSQSGTYTRQYTYPDLSPVLGYTHPAYGQSGLEASLDPYLRGLQGNPGLEIWWEHLLYGQPPAGLDVRLSLDLRPQQVADALLDGQAGAVVLLNASSGEVLAMASSPTFDANLLGTDWETLLQDPAAPLLNRAALGLYPTGAALGPLLLAERIEQSILPASAHDLSITLDGQALTCAVTPANRNWNTLVAAGCPGTSVALGELLGTPALLELYTQLGLYTAPRLRIEAASSSRPQVVEDAARYATGLPDPITGQSLLVSPLQMARAAATLSNGGQLVGLRLALAVNTPQAGWVLLPPLEEPAPVFSQAAARSTGQLLADDAIPVWQSLSVIAKGDAAYTWYLGGTLPDWPGVSLSVVVLLEQANPTLAEHIGQAVLQAAVQP